MFKLDLEKVEEPEIKLSTWIPEPSVLGASMSYFYHSVSLKKKIFIALDALPLSCNTEFSACCGVRTLSCGR